MQAHDQVRPSYAQRFAVRLEQQQRKHNERTKRRAGDASCIPKQPVGSRDGLSDSDLRADSIRLVPQDVLAYLQVCQAYVNSPSTWLHPSTSSARGGQQEKQPVQMRPTNAFQQGFETERENFTPRPGVAGAYYPTASLRACANVSFNRH